jgi:hypothetical protein
VNILSAKDKAIGIILIFKGSYYGEGVFSTIFLDTCSFLIFGFSGGEGVLRVVCSYYF